MKKTYIASCLLAAAAMMTSCADSFLDVESPTQENSDQYFNTVARVQESVVAAYDPLHWTDWSQDEYAPFVLLSDLMADDFWVGGASASDNAFWHAMANYEALPNRTCKALWIDGYSGVKRANDVIANCNALEAAGLTQAQQGTVNYMRAQALVLRAYYYTWLWKFYGNVPYYEENLISPYRAPQISHDELYGHIVENIENALALDALPMKAAAGDEGRVTKAMAYMLYAEVVMYQNDDSRFGTALDRMREIISSGQYALAPDYTTIFTEAGEWSSESIWEINYISQNAVRSWNGPLVAGGSILPTLISPNGWTEGDDDHKGGGWGFAPVRTSTLEMFVEGDTRRDATMWNAQAWLDNYNAGVAADAAKDYTRRYQDTGLWLEKFVSRVGGNDGQKADSEMNFNYNWRIYRYSEVLLNAAELLVRTGGDTGLAQQYLMQVRNRAGLVTVLPATLDNILDERHHEFVGEGKRYWDLIRFGKAASVLVPGGYRTNSWTENKKYLPIPQSEMDKDADLVQNPYMG